MRHLTLLLSLAALAVFATPTEADACAPPFRLLSVEAVGPSDGATDISPDAQVVVQLRPEQGYEFEGKFDDDRETSLLLTLTDEATGASHVVTATLGERTTARAVVVFDAELAPNTAYQAALGPDGDTVHHAWRFATGEGALPELDTEQQLNIDVSGDYTMRDTWSCCPEEFVGQCPTCWRTGQDPFPTLGARFELLQHPLGPAALTYTIQIRNSEHSSWSDGQSQAFDGAESGKLARVDVSVAETFCVRVVAYSVVDDFKVISDEHCAPGSERFGEAPDPVRIDTEGVNACGGETDPDDDVEEDDVEEEDHVDEHEDDEDREQSADDEEGSTPSRGGAVACSHAGSTGTLSGLLLFAVGLLRRRRR